MVGDITYRVYAEQPNGEVDDFQSISSDQAVDKASKLWETGRYYQVCAMSEFKVIGTKDREPCEVLAVFCDAKPRTAKRGRA